MKIAIIGAGFAGLAAAHYLKTCGEVTVFSSEPGASAIAAGLLHKFVGMHAKKNLYGDEALELSLDLVAPFAKKTGLLRPAASEIQAVWFQKAAKNYPTEIELVDPQTIWIKEAWVVDTAAYLATLKTTPRHIADLEELHDFDRVILCTGASAPFVTPVRGQLLEVIGSPLPHCPISGQIYVIPYQERLIVGATYERSPISAEAYLLPRLRALLPTFKLERILAVKSGVRASTPDHLPLIRQLNPKTWVYAGLGSKGLLYHAYYAKILKEKLESLDRVL